MNFFKFPVLIKPRISYAAKGITFFESLSELQQYVMADSFYRQCQNEDSPYIVQEAIEGHLHNVTSCAKAGNIVSLMSQQRLVSLYDFGGGGIINQTTHEPIIMEYAQRI